MKYLKTAAKIIFVVGLLYFLSQKGFISIRDTQRAFDSWQTLAPPLFVLGLLVILGSVRWLWLLEAQGIRLKWLRVLELTLVGNFFNIALPGAVSGDFVKAFYIGKEISGQRARAFGSILFDRVAGLSALSLVSGGAMLLDWVSSGPGAQNTERTMIVLRPFVILSALGTVAFYSYLFLVKESWDPVLIALRRLEAMAPKAEFLVRIYLSMRHYHHHRRVVLMALMISVAIHLSVGWALLQFATALGEGHLPLLAVYTIFPLGLLVTAVPIAPAGVGTGHAAFLYFFRLIGSARGADIFTLFALGQIFYGAIGGLVYLRFRTQLAPVPDAEARASN